LLGNGVTSPDLKPCLLAPLSLNDYKKLLNEKEGFDSGFLFKDLIFSDTDFFLFRLVVILRFLFL